MKNHLLISVCLMLLFSCKKETTKIHPQTELSSAQKKELSSLDDKLKKGISLNEKSGNGVQPYSNDNYMDPYGLNFQNSLLKANELNSIFKEGVSTETAIEQWKNDLNIYYQTGLNDIAIKFNENIVLSLYAESIHNLYLDEFQTAINQNQLLAHTKIFERFIVESAFLSSDEKDALLMEISILKYSIYDLCEFGITLNGTNSAQQGMKPFDERVNDCIGKIIKTLAKELGISATVIIGLSYMEIIASSCVTYVLISG